MGNFIPKALSLERRKKAWDLRVKNYTYDEIAKELGISETAVAKILNKVTKKYFDDHLADVEKVKSEQIAQHEHIAKEAYRAWERSKEVAKTIRKENSTANGQALGLGKQTVEARDQDGDPRYLAEYMKAKDHIRKIIGADAPIKSEFTGKLDTGEARNRLNEKLNKILESREDSGANK